MPSLSCVCLWRVHAAEEVVGGFTLVKILDDPFCPEHHPDELPDAS